MLEQHIDRGTAEKLRRTGPSYRTFARTRVNRTHSPVNRKCVMENPSCELISLRT
ncbi:Uncharacterized protein DAT39_001689 [Clarias magur]|uniref:Uncharacterized protein n=1 Tax=Clarias magur TaxID=1594786 RepID=A0A8J4UVW1_CLAMG|nr:Uncharacterized protein DAT39_001689 [Clarias magur]